MARRLPSGAGLELFDVLDSTSREARRRIESGAALSLPLWIVALAQTDGYGRRGREWRQAPGDFAGTLMLRLDAPAGRLPQLSFLAAVAVAEAIETLAPGSTVACKWPNDLLLGGGKAAGLLLELIEARTGPPVVTLGVGINVVSRPEGVAYPAARLFDHLGGAPQPAPAEICTALDASLARRLAAWRAEGFAPVRDAWLARAARLGDRIEARLPEETVAGVFRGIDADGALLVEEPGGRVRIIAAGEVLPPRREAL